MPQSIGIVGYGAFGRLVHEMLRKLAPGVRVIVSSSRHAPDGKSFVSFADACKADAVVLAVPIHAFEATLKKALSELGKDTVIVDVATVKTHTAKLLKKFAKGKRYIATHPMFGPESYAKTGGDITGYRIVITDHTLPKGEYAKLVSALRKIGFTVVETTSKKHDQHLANTLFLTHFIGQAVNRAGFTRTEIDTISFGFLMEAMESVRNDTELFKDVFRFNPYCKATLEKLAKAETATRKLLGKAR